MRSMTDSIVGPEGWVGACLNKRTLAAKPDEIYVFLVVSSDSRTLTKSVVVRS